MLRNELDARVAERVLANLTSAPSAAIIGATHVARANLPCFVDMAAFERAEGSFDAALWLLAAQLPSGLAALRRKLAPGATLWLVAAREPRPMQRLRALVVRERIKLWTLPELSSALLLAGFRAPRAQPPVGSSWLLSAELPSERDPLDAFFEQPSAHAAR